jgi:prevent-host-death family protein
VRTTTAHADPDIGATLCYMERIGIRELRQNLSVHLRRVKRGESLEVTEHGRPVAVLAPLPEPLGTRERLLAAGRLIPSRGDIAEIGPPPSGPEPELSASQALAEDRAERL